MSPTERGVMKYGIKWRSKTTGYSGTGGTFTGSRVDAERVAAELNEQFPELAHCVFRADA